MNYGLQVMGTTRHRVSFVAPTFVSSGIAQAGVTAGAITLNTTTATLLVAAQNCNSGGTYGDFWDDPGLSQMTITALTSISANVSATYTMNSYAGGAGNALVGRSVWITGMANASNNSHGFGAGYAAKITASSTTSFTVAIANTGGMSTAAGQTGTGVVGNTWTQAISSALGGAAKQNIGYCSLPLVGSSHVFNASGNAFEGSCPVYAFAGGSSGGWQVDSQNSGAITGASNAFTTSTLTLHNTEKEIMFAAIANNNFAPTSIVSMSNSYTGAVNNGHSFANEAGGAAYLIAQAATSGTVFTFNNGGSSAACQVIAAFRKI